MTAHNIKIANKCIKIIRNNGVENAINKIANLNKSDGQKIGRELAINIYLKYSDYSVEYDSEKHGHNISVYHNKVNKNMNKAIDLKQNIKSNKN